MGRKSQLRRYIKSGRKKMHQVKGKFREQVIIARPRPRRSREEVLQSLFRKRMQRRHTQKKEKLLARRTKITALKKLRRQASRWNRE